MPPPTEEVDMGLLPASPHINPDLEAIQVRDLIPRLRELIKHRDESIKCGNQQVSLSNAKNEALRANLDQVEAEVGSLQQALVEANESIRRAGRNRQALEKRIKLLELTLEQLQGRDYAIDVSTKQSNKLLMMLLAEERKQKALEEENKGQKDTIDILRHKVANSAREFGEIVWKLQDQLNRKTSALNKLQEAHEVLLIEHEALGRKYDVERRQSRARIDHMDRELGGLKGQPYQLLDRLQKNEDKLQWWVDANESLKEDMKVVEERNIALSKHLEQAINKGNRFKATMEELQERVPTLEREISKLRSSLEFERADKSTVEGQLYEMSQAVTRLTERQTTVEDKATRKENQLSQIIREKEGVEQTTAQQLSAKERVIEKQGKKIVVLEQMVKQAQEEAERARQQCKETNAKDADVRLHYDLVCMSRRKFLDMHVACLAALMGDQPQSPVVQEGLVRLQAVDFSGCGLTNEEFVSFLDKLTYCPLIHHVDASNNQLTEEASFPLSDYLRGRTCWLHKLDVRYNQFSAQATRRCAVALEHNPTLGITKVEVSHEGLVVAMTPAPPRSAADPKEPPGDEKRSHGDGSEPTAASGGVSGGSTEEKAVEVYSTVFILDMRENMVGAMCARPDPPPVLEPSRCPPAGSRSRDSRGGRAGGRDQDSGRGGMSSTRQIESQRAFRNKMAASAYSSNLGPMSR